MRTKFGKTTRHNATRKVVSMRTKQLASWATIASAIGCSPRTARQLFAEARGSHQFHDHLPNKGGRFPAEWTTAEAPVLPGDGTNNQWDKVGV